MPDIPLTKEQKMEQLHQQVLRICEEQGLTELEVMRILQFNLPIYLKRKEQKPKG